MTAYTWGLQFVCGSFFLWRDPLWSYGMKSGFAEKQFFKLRFFSHMLGLLPIHVKSICGWTWGPGTLLFPNNLKKTEALRKNQNKNLKIRDLSEPGPQAFGFLTRAVLITKIIVYLYTYIYYIILYYIILYCIILYYILYFTLFYYIILYYIILYYIIL